jgi:hypothetical protein
MSRKHEWSYLTLSSSWRLAADTLWASESRLGTGSFSPTKWNMDAANWRSTLRNRRAASSPKRGAPKVTHSAAILPLAGPPLSPSGVVVTKTKIWEQCCGSGCLLPGFQFRIPDPKIFPSRFRIKYFNQIIVSKLWSGLFIPDPDPGSGFFIHPRSRIRGSKRHRIRNAYLEYGILLQNPILVLSQKRL